MEANAKKAKSQGPPQAKPHRKRALKRLEHDLITDDGIVPATKGPPRHPLPDGHRHDRGAHPFA